MKPFASILLATTSFLLVLPALAGPDDPASDATIRAVLEITRSRDTLDDLVPQIQEVFRQEFKKTEGDTPLTPAQERARTRLQSRMTALQADMLDWSRLEPMFLEVYRATFTEREMQDVLAFYRSPPGQAMVERMPRLMQNLMTSMRRDLVEMQQRLQDILRQYMVESEGG
ncbi:MULTISPECIES: DUF2059 domain-containing protein [Ramlibacter]|uniref:DUF2059 domain-containing protein n=1 Tax=Ramlibacter aquaticus TaxID=2780094 RepID=A0ABR9SFE2_9BURK|nr:MULTISPECIES: DUF2059 domain-containing protein [Ramlibacter]MBE7940487.1 DUF2059 domain-containing protein [Ramlibacter aquaticus]